LRSGKCSSSQCSNNGVPPTASDNRVTCKPGARFCACVREFRDFVISQPRNDRRTYYSSRNSGARSWLIVSSALAGDRSARLKHTLQFRIERRHRKCSPNSVVIRSSRKRSIISRPRRFFVMIATGYEFTRLETTACDPQLFLNRLVRIGDAAHDQCLRFRRSTPIHAQYPGAFVFHHDFLSKSTRRKQRIIRVSVAHNNISRDSQPR